MHAKCVAPVLQAVQHTWTYKPLVQDVLGMSLNRVTLDAEPSTSQQILQPNASSKKTYEVKMQLCIQEAPCQHRLSHQQTADLCELCCSQMQA